jgi:hypothetical protein
MIRVTRSKFGNWPSGPSSRLAHPTLFMPGFMGGGGGVAYQVRFALRYRGANSASLTRTLVAGNRNLWSLGWQGVKRGTLGTLQYLFGADTSSADAVYFDSSDRLCVDIAGTTRLVTNAVLRDPTAHYAIKVEFDAANGTAANRLVLKVNGVVLTSFATDTRSGITTNTAKTGTAVSAFYGRNPTSAANYFDGVMANCWHVNGIAAADQGVVAGASGQWVPTSPTGMTNNSAGWLLEFADASAATAAAIGKDTSGNGNNWTPSGISVTAGPSFDQSRDTPTNSFATMNPLDRNSNLAFSDANLTVIPTSTADYWAARATMPTPDSGKWYWELTLNNTPAVYQAGIVSSSRPLVGQISGTGSEYQVDWGTGTSRADMGFQSNGASFANWTGATKATSGDVLMFAFDADNQTFWVGRNGTWYNSSGTANPATNTDPRWSGVPRGLFPYVNLPNPASGGVALNFGQRPFTHTPPSGFLALSTQNLPNPAIPRASNGAVLAIDTEANIEATLATARSGWTDFVEILKNRAAGENWAWRFSHNATHEHAVDTTDTYQTRASRTMSGAQNWVGYAIRIGSAYGTAAGSVSHTNGAATTVTHNLARARTAILLFPRASGDVWYYHPDVTAGSLLRLNTNAAQAANTSITTVGSNSFQIGSGVASGTYDYLVLSDVDGFIDLFNYTGNASTNGPFAWTGQSSNVVWLKDRTAANAHRIYDRARNPFNGAYQSLVLSSGAAEAAETFIEMTAGGMRPIVAGGNGVNDSSSVMCGVAIAFAPFKAATAR